VSGDDWIVTTDTFAQEDRFGCQIHVGHGGADVGFKHQFRHWKTFSTEVDAVLDGCARAWCG
jgi:hypothetical protein